MKILLVEPDFPYPKKSKHKANKTHKNFVPIGLLKIGRMYEEKGHKVKLVRGEKNKRKIGSRFKPDKILVTSLFTYWSKYVWKAVSHYKSLYNDSEIKIGGIYVTLCKDNKKFKKMVEKYNIKYQTGLHEKAEKYLPDYSLLEGADYHLTHTTRGCIRNCQFCGVSKLEPEFKPKEPDEIINEIKEVGKNKIVLFDNNILAHPKIEEILKRFSKIKINGRKASFESQCGFDGRILAKKPHLAKLLKKANFKNIRFAWDWKYKEWKKIKKQLDLFRKAGFNAKEIFIFMIYNWMVPFKEMEKKRLKCWEWGAQISDCRFRPLDQLEDNYNPRKRRQTKEDYFIHDKWTDSQVRQFRRNVRRHNICVRMGFPFYSRKLENNGTSKNKTKNIYSLPKKKVKNMLDDVWFPDEFTSVEKIYKK